MDNLSSIFTHLAQQAARVMEARYTAIVEATFRMRTHRETFRCLAIQLGVPLTILEFCAQEETSRRWVARRSAQANDASEADLAALAGQVAVREPLTAAEQASALTLETDAPQALERLLETIRAIGEEP